MDAFNEVGSGVIKMKDKALLSVKNKLWFQLNCLSFINTSQNINIFKYFKGAKILNHLLFIMLNRAHPVSTRKEFRKSLENPNVLDS